MEEQHVIHVPDIFTHKQYRRAGVAHLLNMNQEPEFYYRGKPISQEKANEIVIAHFRKKESQFKRKQRGKRE